MASIPLSGQIRLGTDFNQQFYYGDSNSAQLNMNSQLMREYSIGGSSSADVIPYGSGAQRNLGMYRGGTGAYPWAGTTSTSTAASSQAYALTGGGGPGSKTNYVKATNPNLIGTGAADQGGVNILAQATGGNTSGSNTATNIVADFGYLEPGNYKVAFSGGSYNTGWHYCIVRGYTGEHLSGSSTNYKYVSRSCTWNGGWRVSNMGTNSSFTVNSTYPYVIMSLETHVDTNYYLNTSINRKDSSSQKGSASYIVNPHIWRVS